MGSPARTLHLARPHHGARTITVERRGARAVMSCFPCWPRKSESNEQQKVQNGPKSSRKPRPPRPDDRGFELLLLGADGSGKSTFIRQMQIIHGRGFNDNDKMELVPHVYDNIFDAMKILVMMVEEDWLNIPIAAPRWEDITAFRNSENPIKVRLEAVRKLWAESGMKECYSRRSEFSTLHPLNVSAAYFLDQIERISETGYLPITEDIVRVRKGTQGIPVPYEFFVSGIKFKITDVGGDRGQRSNWIDVMGSKVTCVIFLAAIDEFDTYILSEQSK